MNNFVVIVIENLNFKFSNIDNFSKNRGEIYFAVWTQHLNQQKSKFSCILTIIMVFRIVKCNSVN